MPLELILVHEIYREGESEPFQRRERPFTAWPEENLARCKQKLSLRPGVEFIRVLDGGVLERGTLRELNVQSGEKLMVVETIAPPLPDATCRLFLVRPGCEPEPFVVPLSRTIREIKAKFELHPTVEVTDVNGRPLDNALNVTEAGLRENDEIWLHVAPPPEEFEAVASPSVIFGRRAGFRRVDSASGIAFGDTHHLAWCTPHPYPWQFGSKDMNDKGWVSPPLTDKGRLSPVEHDGHRQSLKGDIPFVAPAPLALPPGAPLDSGICMMCLRPVSEHFYKPCRHLCVSPPPLKGAVRPTAQLARPDVNDGLASTANTFLTASSAEPLFPAVPGASAPSEEQPPRAAGSGEPPSLISELKRHLAAEPPSMPRSAREPKRGRPMPRPRPITADADESWPDYLKRVYKPAPGKHGELTTPRPIAAHTSRMSHGYARAQHEHARRRAATNQQGSCRGALPMRTPHSAACHSPSLRASDPPSSRMPVVVCASKLVC